MKAITTSRLNEIAVAVNTEHAKIESALREGLTRAVKVGELLNQAKQLVKHGDWGKWIVDNCQFSERTAQNYMRIAARYPELTKSATVADLTYREAVALLAEPKPDPQPFTVENSFRELLGDQWIAFQAWRAAGHPTQDELEESEREDAIITDDLFAFSRCKSPREAYRLAQKRLYQYVKKGALLHVKHSGIPDHFKIADDVSLVDRMLINHAVNVYLHPF